MKRAGERVRKSILRGSSRVTARQETLLQESSFTGAASGQEQQGCLHHLTRLKNCSKRPERQRRKETGPQRGEVVSF